MGWLLLCAGRSSRFGSNKLLASLGNTGVLEQVLTTLEATEQEVYAVCRPEQPEVEALLQSRAISHGCCPEAAQGMGHSLAWGIARIRQWPWCGIVLGDMPFIGVNTLKTLADKVDVESIVIPVIRDASGDHQRGHPVIFGRHFYPQLERLIGDVGARSVVNTHPEAVREILVEDPGILQDVDTPEDLAALSDASRYTR